MPGVFILINTPGTPGKFWGCINYKIAGIKKGETLNTMTNQLNKTDMLLISPNHLI